MREFITKHEKGILRILEILPGFVSWNLILFPYWGILVFPNVVAYFILIFNVYWFYQSLSLAISSVVSHTRIQAAKIYDWMEDVRGFPDWEKLRQVVIIPTYKEPLYILERTLDSLANQDFPTKQIIPVLAKSAFPTKFSLGMGQVNSIVLFLLLFSYMQTLNKKEVFPGILMGVAVMLKPIFAFFLLFFLIQEKWRLIFYSIITVLTGFAVTYAFYGLGIWEYWINDIIFPLLNYAGREVYYNQGFLGFASRFIASIEIRKIIEYIILPVSLIPIFIFRRTKSADLLLSLFILTLLITDSISWQHHFVWLIFPFILLTYYSIKLKGIWFWIFLGISYLLVSWNFKNPLTVPVILLSNTFYGGAILYFLNIYLLKLNLNHHG